MGSFLCGMAEAHRDIGFIGAEPFINGVAAALQGIKRAGLENVLIHPDDVREILEILQPESLDRVYILYPDPWPKTRHHKRRVITRELFEKLWQLLKPNGEIWIATDHAGYASWIMQEREAHGKFTWLAESPSGFRNPPPGWITTHYEQKALAGKPNYLLFRKNASK